MNAKPQTSVKDKTSLIQKPELLAPAGSIEAFFAGLEGGADAFYLGLRDFNARGRAKNFNIYQLQSLLKETEKHQKKVYLTLNTLIKNTELERLLDTLYIVSQTKLAAIIIQDWGVYYLAKKWFPQIKIHASTQMANHNSNGANFSQKLGFERIILARELTLKEVSEISANSTIQLEMFAHGSLCYSFSGMCYFSSYLGGMSANRGLCRQPCRRDFRQNEEESYLFNLNDLQLIDLLPKLLKLNLHSLKIEGRMKSAEYVYQAVRAYRMALDDVSKIPEAKEILKYDFGREKTAYFMGGTIQNAINEKPFTGIFIGNILKTDDKTITFQTLHPLQIGARIRILSDDSMDSPAFKITEMLVNEKVVETADIGEIVTLKQEMNGISNGNQIFLTGRFIKRFKKKFSLDGKKVQMQLPTKKKRLILARFASQNKVSETELFVRIDSLDWLEFIDFKQLDYLIIRLNEKELQNFPWEHKLLRNQKQKIILQLPKFIPEDKIKLYKQFAQIALSHQISHFMLSHLSQKEMLPSQNQIRISASEQVYALNDAAIHFLKEQKIHFCMYPIESDFENLFTGKYRDGIVLLFFYPELFYSRMPIKADYQENLQDKSATYTLARENGCTVILPKYPVSIFSSRSKLEKHGFHRFLIDFSHWKAGKDNWDLLISNYHNQNAMPNKNEFNFKLGLR
jgi:putative protease